MSIIYSLETSDGKERKTCYLIGPDPFDAGFIALMEGNGFVVGWAQVPAALDKGLTRLLEDIHAKQAPERHEL